MQCRGILLASCAVVVASVAATDANAQCSTRFVATTGSNTANDCRASATPCRTLTHAAAQACAGDTVAVAEGTYVEDVLIQKRVALDSSGVNANTILRGTGAGDAVRLLASGITFNGFTMNGPAGGACVRIGDAAHPAVRGVQITNSTISGCSAGVIIDSIGVTGTEIYIAGNLISGHIANGGSGAGAGVVVTGGSGRVRINLNTLADNEGPAVRIDDPGAATNGTTTIVGNSILRNGRGALALARAAIEAHRASDLRVEGNDISGHTGLAAADDGRAALLDAVAGANIFCNRVHDNDGGFELTGSATAISVLHNRLFAHTGAALLALPGTAAGVIVNEAVFGGNGVAVDNRDTATLDARHNWWNAADGPSGAGGSGDAVSGPVDVANFIARPIAPILARGPSEFGWSPSTAGCYDTLQGAINAAPVNGLILVGTGRLTGRAVLDGKRLDIEGLPNGPSPNCSESVINGTQSGGTRSPALSIRNVSGVTVTNLKIWGAGKGVPCPGPHTDDEIGLDLRNVDDSTFRSLCIEENGTTEVRVYGDSDRNLFEDVHIEGMLRLPDGDDECGHRSREGFYVNGGPACEGGPGAIANDNRFVDVSTYHISRSFRIRLAKGTEVTTGIIHGVPAAAWDGGDYAVAFWIDGADDTYIHDNLEIGNRGMREGIRIQGISAGSCVTEELHSERTRIENTTISMVENAATGIVLYHKDGDPGYPLDTSVSCTTVTGTDTAVLAEHVGAAPGPVNRLTLMDIHGNTRGVRNLTADVLPVTNSWWGDPSGPSGVGPGTGNSVTANVDFSGWLASSPLDDADGDGFTECAGDADDTDPVRKPVDTCDGFDNDLDGSTDEDFVSQATSCGVGSCARTGATSCTGGAVFDSCQAAPPLSATDETCDLVDDDCDGSTDEEFAVTPTACGAGGCARSGELACVAGAVQDTCVAGTPAADDSLCNGIDDDCDAATDEEFASIPTSCGVGACASTGATTCVGGVPGDSCIAGTPAADDGLCNGIDDDCDGPVDEDYVVRTLTCGIGECQRSGASSCTDGVESESCTPGPPRGPTDLNCDGIDEDCDGSIDEEFESGPSSCGRGACVAVGTVTCENGGVVDSCVPGTPGPDDAVCDGVDEDCDGTQDEDYVSQPTTCGFAACVSTGSTSCSGGAVVDSCQPLTPPVPTDETCDLVDDDCDGSADEDVPATPTTCGIGTCSSTGTQSCVAGAMQDNCVAGTPAADDSVCDGLDDDCDGTTDEEFATQATSCGLGVCASTGTLTCVDGAPRDSCAAGQPTAPDDSLCNGRDDDCDGLTDEEYVQRPTSCGIGECARSGARMCEGGVEVDTCAPGPPRGPTDLNCDGIDEDCDGSVDEEFQPGPSSCGRGACIAIGTITCENGTVQDSCVPGTPGIESCNNVDDDCDGSIDDELTGSMTCGVGACTASGTQSCVNGVYQSECTPGTPAPDDSLCNALDDDCDGSTDEEFASTPTSCGIGECTRAGATICTNGVPGDSCVAGTPVEESCDGLDNDCDGAPDDVPVPEMASGLLVSKLPGETHLEWAGAVRATGYDLVKGLLSLLGTSGGDFSSATDSCLGNDVLATSFSDSTADPPAGDGTWYLLRAVNCGGPGTYDDGGAGQAPGRDAEIEASGVACP